MVRKKCGFMKEIELEVVGSWGGLSLGWTRDYSVQLRSYLKSHIDVEVCECEGMSPRRLTGFYGASNERCRKESWDLIRQLNGNSSLPWLVIGDFNEIMFFFKKRGARVRNENNMLDFWTVLEDCQLADLGFFWLIVYMWERLFSKNIIYEKG